MIDDQSKLKPYLKPQAADLRVRGITGTQLSAGYISGKERNSQLTGRSWTYECEDMIATDPILRRSWSFVKQTLLSAKWLWKAGDDSEEAKVYADFANRAFGFDGHSGMMSMSFEQQLSYLLEFIPLGFRYAEEIYCVKADVDGTPRVWLDYFADREPTAHSQWLSRDGQQLDGVLQTMVGMVTPEPIPATKLLLLTLNQTGSNFEGVGLLRPCWFWWKQKQKTATLMSIGVEKWCFPTPKIVVDREKAESAALDDATIDTMIENAAQQAQAFVAMEQGFLIENPVVKFDSYGGSTGFDPQKALTVIQECDNQLQAAFMANLLNLGISETGSRAVGEIHLSIFRRSCVNFLDLVTSALSGQDRRAGGTMARLINWNFGACELNKLPRLTHSGLTNDELTDSLASLPALVQASLLTPDSELERSIRQRIGAGDLPTEADRSSMDRQLSQNQGILGMAERLRSLRDE